MYLTTHAAVGVLIAQKTQNPWLAFFGAFISHFILDFVPHGDEGVGEWIGDRKKRIALIGLLDIAGITLLLVALIHKVSLPSLGFLSLGILGSILPDVLANFLPIVHRMLEENRLIRGIDWLHRKLYLATLIRQHRRFHHWIHNPWHEKLPIKLSQEIGLLVQVFILGVFFATEISVLGR